MILKTSQPSRGNRIKVVAAIPCFNTRPFIAEVVSKAKRHVDQVVVIDDGSHDHTAEEAKSAGALVVKHSTNRGYGEAMKSCFEAARTNAADVLIILDGDGQHNPEEIPLLLAPVLKGEADFVIGSRFLTKESSMARYRKFGISVITLLFNLGSRTTVSDAQSGFRAYSEKYFRNVLLSENGMSISIEILEKARSGRAVIKEVPVSCLYVSSTLSLGAIRLGLSIALSVIRIRLKNRLYSLIGGNNAGEQDL